MAAERYRDQTRTMRYRIYMLCGLALLLAGCTAIDGTYYPGCPGYAGDKVELADGRVTWDRFTDVVRVGPDGRPVDPFPDYPRYGRYEVHGKALSIELEGEEETRRMYIHVDGERLVLLTADQYADWERTGRYDDCALTREGAVAD